jgi:hypothetical protein
MLDPYTRPDDDREPRRTYWVVIAIALSAIGLGYLYVGGMDLDDARRLVLERVAPGKAGQDESFARGFDAGYRAGVNEPCEPRSR